MNKKKLLSIVTVCYNSEKEIEKTIQSVYSQTFNDYQYVIKDGGSTDKTNEIIASYQKQFEEKGIAFVHISASDGGIYEAMNESLQYCNGTWVNYMNAGDIFFDSQVLEDVFSELTEKETDVIFGDAAEKEGNECYLWTGKIDGLTEKCTICHQAFFCRTEIMKEIQFNTDYRIGADYDFFLKLFLQKRNFKKINRIITVFGRDGVSSTNEYKKVEEMERIKRSYGLSKRCSFRYCKNMMLAIARQVVVDSTPETFSIWLKKVRRKKRGKDKKVLVQE